jgi:hypothetical protein
MGATLPASTANAGPAQAMFDTLPALQLHVEGQSLLVAQGMLLAWHDEVDSVVVVQVGV